MISSQKILKFSKFFLAAVLFIAGFTFLKFKEKTHSVSYDVDSIETAHADVPFVQHGDGHGSPGDGGAFSDFIKTEFK